MSVINKSLKLWHPLSVATSFLSITSWPTWRRGQLANSFVWSFCPSLTWKLKKINKTPSRKMKVNIRRPRRFWSPWVKKKRKKQQQQTNKPIKKRYISLFHQRISVHSQMTAPISEADNRTEKHILNKYSQRGERLSDYLPVCQPSLNPPRHTSL